MASPSRSRSPSRPTWHLTPRRPHRTSSPGPRRRADAGGTGRAARRPAHAGRGPTPADAPAPLDDADTADQSDPVDQPTQAGMPIFDDEDDEVSWFTAAPGPAPAAPAVRGAARAAALRPRARRRRSRPAAAARRGDARPAGLLALGHRDRAAAGTGSGVIPVTEDVRRRGGRPGPLLDPAGRADRRLAAAPGRGRDRLQPRPRQDAPGRRARADSPSPTQATDGAAAAAGAGDRGRTPTSTPRATRPRRTAASAPLAVDGDPATTWPTSTYDQQFGPGGLKTGVGLVRRPRLRPGGRRDRPDDRGGSDRRHLLRHRRRPRRRRPSWSPWRSGDRGRATGCGPRLDEPASGQYLVVWLTSLPAVDATGSGARSPRSWSGG